MSKAELRNLTGTPSRVKQFAWLTGQGIPATEDYYGALVVLKAAVEARLMPGKAVRTAKKTEPDLSALNRTK